MNGQDLDVQPGDIFACWGTDWISRGISLETSLTSFPLAPPGLRWSPSHVALATRWQNSYNVWAESTSFCDHKCLSAEKAVVGAQIHLPGTRIEDYLEMGGAVYQYRLTAIDELDFEETKKLQKVIKQQLGSKKKNAINYDTAGAIFSGLRILPWLPISRNNMDSLFCSELIAAVLQRLCRLNRSNPAAYNPGVLMRQLVRQGTYTLFRKFEVA